MNSQMESGQGLKIVAAYFLLMPVVALLGLYVNPRMAAAAFLLQLFVGLGFIAALAFGIWEPPGAKCNRRDTMEQGCCAF